MRGGFASSLVFAAVAALTVVAWVLAVAPLVSRPQALGSFAIGSAALYLVTLSARWSQRLVIAGVAGSVGLATLVLAPPATQILIAAFMLAVGRSVFLLPGRPARTLVVELVLIGGGLLVARLLFGRTVLDAGLACWGFYLVQSFFFLVGREPAERAERQGGDPFDHARARVETLLRDSA